MIQWMHGGEPYTVMENDLIAMIKSGGPGSAILYNPATVSGEHLTNTFNWYILFTMEDSNMQDKLLHNSLMAAAQTGADLLEILQAIIDASEYEDDYVKVDPEAINIARNYLHEFQSPLMMGDDSDTLH